MSIADLLAVALRQRRVVRFRYLHSDSGGERTCHPQVLFENAAGDLLLDAVQVSGPSDSGAQTRWRTFDPDYIADLSVLRQRFEPDSALNLQSPKYHRILAQCRGPSPAE